MDQSIDPNIFNGGTKDGLQINHTGRLVFLTINIQDQKDKCVCSCNS